MSEYRAIITKDDPVNGEANVDSRSADPAPTFAGALALGRYKAIDLGWEFWGGQVERGKTVPWFPEPGIKLTEWEAGPTIAYFGPDWAEKA